MLNRVQRTGLWPSILVLLSNGLLLAWLLFVPDSRAQFYPGIDTLMAGVELLTACLGFAAFASLHKQGSSLQRMPLLLALGVLWTFIAQAINVYYDLHQGQTPYPSIADFFYLSAYPVYVCGILLFPVSRLSSAARARRAADGLLMILALGTLSWYFVLGPTLLQAQGTLAAQLTSVAYPFADLLLLCCVVVLYTRGSRIRRDLLLPLVLLAMGVLCLTLTDSLDGFMRLNNLPTSNYEFLGWSTGYLLIGIAMQVVRSRGQAEGVAIIERPSWKQSLLPYVLVAAVIPLICVLWQAGRTGVVANGASLGCLLVIVVVLLRQILAIRTVHEANTRLEAMSTTDPLTELPNHRALAERLEQEVARARRYARPFSLLFFDGDHFKRVNDTYGHSGGDAVLQELGQRVQRVLRAGDTVGRYGGEEFLVLLPETSLEEACEIAERVRQAIAGHPLATSLIKEGIPTTISLGVAAFPTDGMTVSELVEQADQAMYWSKRLGRNQVRTAQEAVRLREDEALVATISNLERGADPTADGVSLEQVVRAKQLQTIQSLMWLLELRDKGILSHCYAVSDLAGAIARELGQSEGEVFSVTTAALLHDLGKIALPDGLLSRAGSITPAERTLIQQHPALGAQILEVSPFLHHLMPAVQHHHENWDGSGYPDGLRGQAIPPGARIIRVAEAYHAMTTDRPYQRNRSTEEARAELARWSGTHFDPTVVQTALRVLAGEVIAPVDGGLPLAAGEHTPALHHELAPDEERAVSAP